MRLFLISAFLLIGCAQDDNPFYDHDMGADAETAIAVNTNAPTTSTFDENSEIWVCHHPGTEQHGAECVELMYPKGCYLEGDSTKFCWLLNEKDCDSPLELPPIARENFCQSSL